MSQLDAFNGVFNCLISIFNIRRHEILMDGQADQIDPVQERMPFQALHVADFFRIHLAVQNIHTFHAQG